MTKLEELESLARAATPGPWTAHDNHGCYYVSNGKDGRFAKFDNRICELVYPFAREDKRKLDTDFIAALNPAQALKLIEVIRVQKEALEKISELRVLTKKSGDYVNDGVPMIVGEALSRAREVMG